MAEYILFLDETKSNADNPYFCLAGFAIMKDDYENVLIPAINDFKKKYYGDTNVVFHFTKMKKNINILGQLKPQTERIDFWADLHSAFELLPIITFGCYFDSKKAKDVYPRPKRGITEYDIALYYIAENYAHYLRSIGGVGSIILESRTMKENQKILDYFYSLQHNGTLLVPTEDIRRHISSIGFIIKQDNCAGLQVADFIPSSFITIKRGKLDYYGFGKLYTDKLYSSDNTDRDMLGLRKIF
ncbi:MAG: DUF3800 domain-containing protein [Oscillospiraceae bacterium]|nr:DUF3800 domain-containing protein [Oscillospiraceae bacterium]